jgi:branched-subunit amino acid ABC-type transport system permease component
MVTPLGVAAAVLDGLVVGSVVAVGAVGLTLSYAVTRFVNFAYGELLTLGAYGTFALAAVGTAHLPAAVAVPLAAVAAVAVVAVVGAVVARVAYDPLADRGPLPLLLTSIGVAYVLRNGLRAVAGTDPRTIPTPLLRPVEVAGLRATPVELGVVVVAVAAMAGVHLLLRRTRLGLRMRATSRNRSLAEVAGVDTDRVVRRTWLVSSAVGAAAGVLLGVVFAPFRPSAGWEFLVVVFAATLLGGIGRPYGAMVGSLAVGVATSLGTRYLAPEYTQAYAFAVIVAVLLFRPQGIAGGEP